MSKEIDEKVVSMQFDNRNFEANVKTSMSTLDKLKEKLHFKDADKGIDNINKSVKNFDASPMSKAVETVHAKFSALEVMGVTALANITNSAVNAGKRIAHSLTIAPVKSGFDEYELKMGSIQTIMASTGESLETVNKYLNELNEYSDKTIYSFSDMTSNIGKFTNAGVKLEDAVMAIKGISNEAAVSGANANEASRAMYNFAQALSAGYVKLIDWKSIEIANMATVEFKNQLLETAVSCGTLTKTSDGMYKTSKRTISATHEFNDSLTDQWMTTDVLVKTLRKYADENTEIGKKALDAAQDVKTFSMMMNTLKESVQSGWAATFEIIFGNFEEAKKMWSSITKVFDNIISKASDWRNGILGEGLKHNEKRWDSLTEKIKKAGVPLDEFNKKLKENAKAGKVDLAKLEKEYGTFETAVKNGKVSSDIIIKTIKDMAGQESQTVEKMAKGLDKYTVKSGDWLIKIAEEHGTTWEKIYELNKDIIKDPNLIYAGQVLKLSKAEGDCVKITKEQASALKELAKEADKANTPLNQLIKDLEKPSGRTLLIETFSNAFDGLKKSLLAVKDAWFEVFYPGKSRDEIIETKGQRIYRLIEALHKLSEKLKMTDETADKLKRTFKGVFAIFKIITTVVGGAFNILKAILQGIGQLFGIVNLDILSVTAKIGDLLVKIKDWVVEHDFLSKAITKTVVILGKFIKKIYEWISALLKVPGVQNTITKFYDTCKSVFGKIGDYFAGGAEKIKEFADRVSEIDKLSLSNVKKILVDFRDNVLGYFFNFGAFGDMVKKAFSKVGEGFKAGIKGIKENVGSIGDFFKLIKDKIMDFISFIRGVVSFGDVTALLFGVGFVKSMTTIANAIKKLTGPIEAVTNILNSFAGVGKALTNYYNAKALKVKSNVFKNLAISIALLAASIYILSKIDTKKLWSVMGAIGALMAGLTVLSLAVSKIKKPEGMVKLGTCILFMSMALINMVKALKKMDSLDPDNIKRNIGILALMWAGLTLVVRGLGKADKSIKKGALMFIGIAVAVNMLVGSLKKMESLNGLKIHDSLKVLLALMAGMALIAAATKRVKLGGALALIGIAVVLKNIISVLENVTSMDTKKLNSGMIAIVKIFAMIAVVMISTMVAGRYAASAGVAMIGIGISLILIVSAMKLIGKMDGGSLKRASSVIAKMLGIFALIVAASLFAGKYAIRAGVMLLFMAGALFAMTIVISILKNMKPDGMDQALKVIKTISLMFSILIASTAMAKKSTGALLILTVALVSLIGAMYVITKLKPEAVKTATACLTAIIGAFSALIAATSLIAKSGNKFSKVLGIMPIMVLVVAGLALILAQMTKRNVGKSIKTAVSLSILINAFAAMCKTLSKTISINKSAIKSIYALSGVVAVMAIILGVLSKLEIKLSISSAISLSIIINALASACIILSNVTDVSKSAIKAAYALSAVVVILGSILGVLNKYDLNTSISTAISLSIIINALASACVILSVVKKVNISALKAAGIMSGIVGLLGLIVGGVNKLGFKIPIDTAISLSILLMALSTACVVLGLIGKTGPAAIEGAAVMATVVVELGALLVAIGALMTYVPKAEEFLDKGIDILSKIGEGIGKFVGSIVGGVLDGMSSSLPNVADNLSEFMDHLEPFLDKVSGIDSSSISGVKTLTGTILALTGASFLDAIKNKLSFFIGKSKTFSELGDELVPLGDSMIEFSNKIKGKLDNDSVEAAASAGNMLASLAKSIPKSGGLLQGFTGEHDFESFRRGIVPFGMAMVEFSDKVSGNIDSDAVEAAANAGKMMTSLVESIPRSSGVVQAFTGEHDFESFRRGIVPFGMAMVEFSDKIDGNIDDEAVEAAVNAGKMMTSLVESIPKSGGVVQAFTGEHNFAKFSVNIVIFGEAMCAFSDSIAGKLDSDSVEDAVNAGKMILGLQASLPKSGGIEAVKKFFTGGKSFKNFKKSIGYFADGIAIFADKSSGISEYSDDMKETCKSAKNILEISNTKESVFFSKKKDFKNFKKNMSNFTSGISEFAYEMSDYDAENIYKSALGIGLLLNATNNFKIDQLNALGEAEDESEGMTNFAKSIKAFVDNFDDVDQDKLINASIAGKRIGEMLNALPKSGGTSSQYNGVIQIGQIATDLTSFGTAIKNFAAEVVGIDGSTEEVEKAAAMGTAIGTMASELPEVKDLQNFFGIGNMSTLAAQLPTLGEGISKFADSVKGIDVTTFDAAVKSCTSFGDLVTALKSKQLSDNLMAGNLSTLSDQLPAFGEAVATFGVSVSSVDINTDVMGNVAKVAKDLPSIFEDIANLPDLTDGTSYGNYNIWSTGKIAQFARQLPALGNGLGKFGASISANGIDGAKMKSVSETLKGLPDIFEDIVNLSDLTDGTSYGNYNIWSTGKIAQFAKQLPTLGNGLGKFGILLKDVNPDTMSKAVDVLAKLPGIAESIPDISSLTNDGKMSSKLATFGTQLEVLGSHYAVFLKSMEGINIDGLSEKVDQIEALRAIAESIPNVSSITTEGKTINKLETFGTQLELLGEYVKSFTDSIKDINTQKFSSTVTEIDNVINTANKLSDASLNNSNGSGKLAAFGTQLKIFGSHLADFSNTIDGLDLSTASGTIEEAGKIADTIIDEFKDKFNSADLKTSVTSMLDEIQNAITSKNDSIKTAGETLAKQFKSGMESGCNGLSNKFTTEIDSALTDIKAKYDEFESAGSYLAEGFEAGIKNKIDNATIQATAMAMAALTAIKLILRINSPSKETYKLGNFTGMGFVNALKDSTSKVYDAGSDVGDSAMTGLKSTLSKLKGVIEGDIDTQPTIRPVLDLSDVNNGVGTINGLLDMGATIGVSANVSSISSAMNKRIQNRGNDDVISAINSLKGSISNSNGNTYNINGVTYDDGSNISNAVEAIVRAARVERRI